MQPAISSLTVQNVLSFGDVPTTLDLRPLNVLIGANGSGKSNLIEVLGLLKAAPTDVATPICDGGGIDEWLWKGGAAKSRIASVHVTLEHNPKRLRYSLAFTKTGFRFEITRELIMNDN